MQDWLSDDQNSRRIIEQIKRQKHTFENLFNNREMFVHFGLYNSFNTLEMLSSEIFRAAGAETMWQQTSVYLRRT